MINKFSRALFLSLLTAALLPAAASADDPILPLSQVTPGMSCTAKTVFSGETPASFPVTVRDIYRDPQYGDYLLVEVGGAAASTGIAQGMSGSPVYCPGPEGPSIAGALSYGIGWESDTVGLATPIESMISQLPSANVAATRMPKAVKAAIADRKEIPTPMVASGIAPQILKALQKRSPNNPWLKDAKAVSQTATEGAAGRSRAAAASELNPGDSMGLSFSYGDWTYGGIGTVSYRQGSRIWAFGHPFMDVGNSDLFLTTAPITTIVDGQGGARDPSYKLGVIGQPVGNIDNDSSDSISGVLGATPKTTTQVASVSGINRQTVSAQLANEQAQGYPHFNVNEGFAGTSLSEGAYKALNKNWVSKFSSRTCWQITVAGVSEPFKFCRQVASYAPVDPWTGAGAWLGPLVNPEYDAVSRISDAEYANLDIQEVKSDANVYNTLQVAQLKSAKQVGKTRKGVAQVKVTYLNAATGATQTTQVPLRVGSKSRGRTVTVKGALSSLAYGANVSNLPSEFGGNQAAADPTAGPQTPDPAKSEEELRSQIKDLNGVTQVKLTGLKGGSRFNRVDLNRLLPLGATSFKVK